MTQQARNLAGNERLENVRFLIRDHDSKFPGSFDEVLRTEHVQTIKTPIRSPKANAFAERWIRTAREDCLDHLLITGRGHLRHTMSDYIAHYNAERPHRALALASPNRQTPQTRGQPPSGVSRRDILGDVLHEYRLAAA